MDPKLIAPLITGVVLVWVLYRRLGRLFGRQAVNATRCVYCGATFPRGVANTVSD